MSPFTDKANVDVTVPESLQGEVMQTLNRLGGIISNIYENGGDSTRISAVIPRAALPNFKVWLQNYTNGGGNCSEFSE